MTKKGKLYIALLVITILGIVALEMNKPKKINWFPSYTTHHKIPFGTYIFNDLLGRNADSVIAVNRSPYEYLKSKNLKGTYLFINNSVTFGEQELNDLLDWTSQGNTLFIASENFEPQLLDTLHLETRSINIFDNFNNEFDVKLVNPNLTNKNYKFERANTLYYFNKIDTLQTKVLAIINKFNQTENEANEKALTNVIKQPFGDGEIILSAFPQAFTNYFILKDDCKNYTSGIMSYINMDLPIYADSHYKSGKTFYTSPMYLFLNTKELKWAYYIVLIGALIYIIFEGKRKQRAIPIVKPLGNKTLDFTRTISNMYYESSKHKDIAHHKIQHFLEYIRTHLHLGTSEINDSFIEQLASRSNNTVVDTQHLFETINTVTKANSISETRLERLNTLIEQFKSNNQWKTKA